jgi:translocation and assembly module TamA
MSDFASRYAANRAGLHHRTGNAVLVCLALWLSLAQPLQAAETVELVVSGLAGDTLKNVQDTLVLPPGLVRNGKVDQLWLERFAKQAEDETRSALEPFGYYNPLVTVSTEPAGAGYRLLVQVRPGEPVYLREVTVNIAGAGSASPPLRELVAAFPLHQGDILLQQRYEEAKATLKSRAQDLGYLDAEFSRHEIRLDRSGTTATIELLLDTSQIYYFGATKIQGAPDYPESFLGRHLTYQAGEIFSYPLLGETQRNFNNSERFKEVVVTPEKQDAEAFQVPIRIELKAAPRMSLRPGIGYGTDTGTRFTVRYRDLNLFHQGHEFYSHLYVAERLQGLATGYILPSPVDVRSSTTLQLNLQKEDTTSYASRIVALELDRIRSLGANRLGAAYVRALYEDYAVGAEESSSRLLLPGLRYSDDHYDNSLRPSRGFRYALDLRGTHQALGSDTALLQLLAEGSYLLPLPWSLALHTRAKAGATLFSDTFSDIPPSLRFFAGGDQSVRGYSYKSLGPRDASGQVVGGKQLLTGSIELERALPKDWSVSLFYDAGNTFNSYSGISLFQGAGVGVHYYTSVGALNLSVARPLTAGNPSLHVHFTVGFEL